MFLYSAFGEGTLSTQEMKLLEMLKIAEKFGWTLEYIKSMDHREYNRVLQLIAGENRAIAMVRKNPKAFGVGGE